MSTYLAHLFKFSGKSQVEVAREVGVKPSTVSMMISGRLAMPPLRVPAFAKALDADPKTLLMLALRDAYPGLYDLLVELHATETEPLSDFDKLALGALREAADGVPLPTDPESVNAVTLKFAAALQRQH